MPISWGSSRASLTLPDFLSGFVGDPLASVSVLPCGTWRTLAADPSRFQIGPPTPHPKIHRRRSEPRAPTRRDSENIPKHDLYDGRHTGSSQRWERRSADNYAQNGADKNLGHGVIAELDP